MVSSPHYLASLAGLRILQDGGSAVDAAIAVNSTLGVVYPHMTGMGGDAFWLIYDAELRSLNALNGSGRAVAAASLDFYRGLGHSVIPPRGPLAAVTVPGAVDSWCMAQERFGKLPLAKSLASAISYARDGYPVSAGQARFTTATADILARDERSARTFMPSGSIPKAGEMMSFPALARTMESVAEFGRAGFYSGPVAAEIVKSLNAAGGIWTTEDLVQHRGTWEKPISTDYRGHTLYQHPPNSQGFVHLMIMNVLEQFNVAGLRNNTEGYVHLVVEATKRCFADRDRFLSDPDRCPVPLDDLLSKEYAKELAGSITPVAANAPDAVPMGQDTTCTVVVDRWGNAVSVIQSLYHEFGSGFVAGDTGVVLQNRGSFFSLDEANVNRLEPGKRCFHTLMPGMIFRDGSPRLVYGTMGGEGQPQTSTVIATSVIDFGRDVQTTVDGPRWLYGRTWGEATTNLRLERRFSEFVVHDLRQSGHRVELVEPWSDAVGHAAAIEINPESKVLYGAADARGEGIAVGW
jgi:gamma-glutamyltranspeptidase